MNTYQRHRFPPDIISYPVWLYFRFNLSHRDIEDLLAERGMIVTRESIRLWCIKFGAIYARRLKREYRPTMIPFTSMKYSSKSTASSITCGGPLIRMARWLMYFYRPGGMVLQQSASSGGWCDLVALSPGKS